MTEVESSDVLKGRIHWRGEPEYEEARVGPIFNARRPQRFPAGVVLASCVNDVVWSVNLARGRGLKISMRSGGHSWAAWSVRDEALLIDVGNLQEMSFDSASGIVEAGPAATGGNLNQFLEQHGRMFPGGHCSSVGIGGFLLQGGQGWNARGWGWACEWVVGVDVVLADGRLVHASERENSGLLWAARGAGPGFFGVVVKFYLRTRELPKAITQSTYVYSAKVFDDVLTWAHQIHKSISTCVEIVIIGAFISLPEEMEDRGPHVVVHALAMAETRSEALEALQPFETCPVLDQAIARIFAVPTSLAQEYEEIGRQNPEGHRYIADTVWTSESAAKVIPALRDTFTTLPTRKSFAFWYSMAPLRELPDMAFSMQEEVYLSVYAIYEDPAQDDAHRAWVSSQMKKLETISTGLYLGDSDLATRPARFIASQQWTRLENLRKSYDPDGTFLSYLSRPDTPVNSNSWEIPTPLLPG